MPRRTGIDARSAGLVANQGAKRIVWPGVASALAFAQASARVAQTAMLVRPAALSAVARRDAAGPKRAAWEQARAAAVAACSKSARSCGVRVHRARAQVVFASCDQDHRAGRVQLQAGGDLGGRGRERVADDLAAVDESETLAAQCQALPARQRVGDRVGRGAGEQRAGAGEQTGLGPGRRRQRGGRAEVVGLAVEPHDQALRLDARARVARPGRAACSAASGPARRRPALRRPGRRRSRPSSRPPPGTRRCGAWRRDRRRGCRAGRRGRPRRS